MRLSEIILIFFIMERPITWSEKSG